MVSLKRPVSGRCTAGRTRYSDVQCVALAGCLIVTAYNLAQRSMRVNVIVIRPGET